MSKFNREIFVKNNDNSISLKNNGIEISNSTDIWIEMSKKYDVSVNEVALIDFNRTGVSLPNQEVKAGFRVRFISSTIDNENNKTWFALPVRRENETNFSANGDHLKFKGEIFAHIGELFLDTCDTNYQRGPHLLNLNSRSRGSCGGCTACVHNYKDLYDESVIKDKKQLITKNDIEEFFENKKNEGLEINKLKQIAVVTGLFGSEKAVVDHMKLIHEVVEPMGFKGELMYFGCEVNSKDALDELSNLGKFSLIYAIDNFTKRDEILAKKKSSITLNSAIETLTYAKSIGIETTFAYIAGIDNIKDMKEGFIKLKKCLTKFPIINIYQIQTEGQLLAIDEEAKKLEYYIKARKIIEEIFSDTNLKPKRWENYRPLWYEVFNDKILINNSFGDNDAEDIRI